jgi:phenylpyruvate tautomerase PptA (4-oxalocrotonate tautomerase family)
MPIVTMTVRKPCPPSFKASVLDAVHAALVGLGVHPQDRFHRVLELDEDSFRFDPTYPDLASARTNDFVLLEILWGVGRSAKVKKQLLEDLMAKLARQGVNPDHVMVCFQELPWENWSASGGRLLHA